jgi:5-methylcytosine-specific restriction protein A
MNARAPKFCANAECGNLVPAGQRYCPECEQPWKTSQPTRKSPSADAKLRKVVRFVLKRDRHQCQIRYVGICIGVATEVDHIIPVSQGGTDHPSNLEAACRPCHLAKSADEGHIAQGHKPKGRIRFIPKEIQNDLARQDHRRA